MTLALVKPALAFLPGYQAALERGWSPDNVRKAAAIRDELDKIAADPSAFVAALDDPDAKGGPITLPDGSTVARLPGFHRWLWDGASAEGSASAGRRVRRRCRPTFFATSAMASCRGNAGTAMPNGRWR
jgi:hypothetical protein